jgi:hypothetical protein
MAKRLGRVKRRSPLPSPFDTFRPRFLNQEEFSQPSGDIEKNAPLL